MWSYKCGITPQKKHTILAKVINVLTAHFTNHYHLCALSSANIPYTYTIKNKKQIDFSKSEYVMRLYQNGSTSGTGTQKASWSVYPENIKSKFAEQTTGTASNAKVTLLLEWKD